MKVTPRQGLIWSALIMTLGATLWTALFESTNDAAVQATARTASSHQQSASVSRSRIPTAAVNMTETGSLDLAQLKRAPWQNSQHNLFSGAQAAPTAAVATPMIQQAVEIPPVPFTYAGALEDHGQYIVFLSMGDKNVSVKTGDVIGDWKIKEIKPPHMTLSYQPLRADVPMMIGESN